MNVVRNYFNTEKNESVLFIIVGAIAITCAIYFMFFQKHPVYKGMVIPLMIVAFIQIIVGATVYVRSPKDIIRVEQMMRNEKSKIQDEEIPRMKIVMKNFVIYRYVEIVLLLLVLIVTVIFSTSDFFKGFGIALFLQSAIMLVLDFFAEKRGIEYLNFLNDTLS